MQPLVKGKPKSPTSQSTIPTFTDPQKSEVDPILLYGVYRDYLKHEDELINRRLSWNLTIQGFLFTAYGLVTINSGSNQELKALLRWLQCLFPLLGAVVSSQSLIGIYAAQNAIDGLKSWWNESSEILGAKYLPELTGGGRNRANRFGRVSQYIPIAIIVAWASIFVMTVRSR